MTRHRWVLLAALLCAAPVAIPTPSAAQGGIERLYVLDCGQNVGRDQARWSPGVFGDGSVTILSTPGHTPGHQSLLVVLPKTGALVLSGDAVHFRDNWEQRRVPSMNVNRDQTLASLERLASVLAERKATLWINHDRAQSATLRYAPAFYE